MDQAEKFLTELLQALVDKPEAVKVTRTVDEMGVLMTVDVDPEDMGKIIGRKGATAKSIRTLLRVVGMKDQQRVNMKINEPEGGYVKPESSEAQAQEAPRVEAASAEDVDDAIADLKAEL